MTQLNFKLDSMVPGTWTRCCTVTWDGLTPTPLGHYLVRWPVIWKPSQKAGRQIHGSDIFRSGFGSKLGVAVMSLSGLIVGLSVGFYLPLSSKTF